METIIAKQKPIYICANVILRQGDDVLLVLRGQTRFASGLYGVVSGAVEEGETIPEAAVREVYEEVGLRVREEDLAFYTLIHAQEKEGIHMSTFFMTDRWEGDVQNREPHKHKAVQFHPLHGLPNNVIPYVTRGLAPLRGVVPHRYYQSYRWDEKV